MCVQVYIGIYICLYLYAHHSNLLGLGGPSALSHTYRCVYFYIDKHIFRLMCATHRSNLLVVITAAPRMRRHQARVSLKHYPIHIDVSTPIQTTTYSFATHRSDLFIVIPPAPRMRRHQSRMGLTHYPIHIDVSTPIQTTTYSFATHRCNLFIVIPAAPRMRRHQSRMGPEHGPHRSSRVVR